MAYPKRQPTEPDEAFAIAWVRERFGLCPGDSVRFPTTKGGVVRVSHQRGGRYEEVEIDLPGKVAAGIGLTGGHGVKLGMAHDSRILITPLLYKAKDLFGIAKYDGPPLPLEEMDEAIAQAVTERYLRR